MKRSRLLSMVSRSAFRLDMRVSGILTLALVSLSTMTGCAASKVGEAQDASLYDKSMAPFLIALDSGLTQRPLPESAGEALRRGDAALAAGDLGEALLFYLESHKLAPKDAQPMVRLGRLHRQRQELDLAEQASTLARELEPDAADPVLILGLIKLAARERPMAERFLTEALKRDPKLWEAHEGLGVLADLRKDHRAALEHYEAALNSHPSPRLLNNLGYSYYLAGDAARAGIMFQRALNLNPGFHRARYNLGLAAAKLGAYDEAIAIFSQVMQANAAHNNVGYVCMMDGKYDQAEAFFRKAIQLSPRYDEMANDNLQTLQRLRVTDGDRGAGGLSHPLPNRSMDKVAPSGEEPRSN